MAGKISLLMFLIFSVSDICAQHSPVPAGVILNDAYATARKENKKVFVLFHASWCTWCKKMDSSMNDASCKKLFDDNYVTRHLVVYEENDKKNLETPGALELLSKYKGEKLGLPYWIIFDVNGNLIGEARMPSPPGDEYGKSTGCPAFKEEVDYFIDILKKTSRLTDEELEIIRKRFQKNEVKYK